MKTAIPTMAVLLLASLMNVTAMADNTDGYNEPVKVLKDMALAPKTPVLIFDASYTRCIEAKYRVLGRGS